MGQHPTMFETALILVSVLVFLGIGGYVFLMVYYPEWVGITGDSAKQTMSEHAEGSSVDDRDIFSSETKRPD